MDIQEVAVIATVAVALSGYLFTYAHQRKSTVRAAKLERLNLQIRNLYGPLYATLQAHDALWEAFQRKHWPPHGENSFFVEGVETTPEEAATWRLWMLEVFEPLNIRIEKLILENGDLIEGDEFPRLFIDALAYIAAYRAPYQQWRDGDFSDLESVFEFPEKLSKAVAATMKALLTSRSEIEDAV